MKFEKNKAIVYIDGDILSYRSAYAAEVNQHKVFNGETEIFSCQYAKDKNNFLSMLSDTGNLRSEKTIRILPPSWVHNSIDHIIRQTLKSANTNRYVLCLSGGSYDNFRNEIAITKGYKANRDGKKKPHHYQTARDYMLKDPSVVLSVNCEADDLLAIALHNNPNVICATVDKDLRTVPGFHMELKQYRITEVNQKQANYNFAFQLCVGDVADNIPGLSHFYAEAGLPNRIGKVRGNAIIKDCNSREDFFNAIIPHYIEATGSEERALTVLQEIGTLLWMQRLPNQVFSVEQWVRNEI